MIVVVYGLIHDKYKQIYELIRDSLFNWGFVVAAVKVCLFVLKKGARTLLYIDCKFQ